MDNRKYHIIDKAKGTTIDFNNPPLKYVEPLKHLPQGLFKLAKEVREIELSFLRGSKNINETDWGLLACRFHWFGNSIVNYLRFVALIEIMSLNKWTSKDINSFDGPRKIINFYCTFFVKEASPEIYKWRNKIGAHFAATAPRKDDNLGTLEYSGMSPVMYSKPYFYVGGFDLVVDGESSDFPKWSLTKEYERLNKRFWANLKIDELQKK